MAIITYSGHTGRAKAWFEDGADQSYAKYFVIGQTAEWPGGVVPAETEDETIDDPICYKKVESKYFVVLKEDAIAGDYISTVEYRGNEYAILCAHDSLTLDDVIYRNHCRWVLVTTWLNYDEAPTGVGYRKIGVTIGLTRQASVSPSKYLLLPAEVADPGHLEAVANDVVTVRSANKRERLAVLLEF